MASSFILLTNASASSKLMPMYLSQLLAAEIPHRVYNEMMTSPNDGSMGRCIEAWRRWAQENASYDRLIITDAWDVLCYGTKEQVAEALPKYPIVVFAAERNCYPEPELATRIGNWGTPWNFVNAGMLTASPQGLIDWCAAVEAHPQYDPGMLGQQWLNRRWSEASDLIHIDFRTRLFYCMFLESQEPYMMKMEGRPFNSYTGNFPPLVHFNGSWPWQPFLEMMNA